ncbi:phosphoribosylformylglycinamidine synthase, partial [Candidatus Microgenomates bacterium]|nr:phosphoribosylformylglycinamidine synthase [Candidatus Microgenomates bacterium]
MAVQIQIIPTVPDTRATQLIKTLRDLGYSIDSLRLTDSYTIDKRLTPTQVNEITALLVNPVFQQAITQIDTPFTFAVEIGFLPGVTDNVAATVKELIAERLKAPFTGTENLYSSQVLYIKGSLTAKEAAAIGTHLANPLIKRSTVISEKDYKNHGSIAVVIPTVKLTSKGRADHVNLNVRDDELIAIGKQGIKNRDGTRRGPLALNLQYMKTIQAYFKKLKRMPTDIELESIAQTWSEHCKHTIFADPIDEVKNGLFKTYIKGATDKIRKKAKNDICVSVFTDNSGAIAFDDDYLVTHKVETHNSPSALDPFGGAITGIVGVNRDALGFGLGAKPIANVYGYCFADPRDTKPLFKGPRKTQQMLSPRQIMDGVIAGVNAGGNQSGIPTVNGFTYFDNRYKGKPLIFVGTIGLIPRTITGRKSHVKKARPGDYIVVVGGRVGLDGIHGATFSSEALDSGSPATAVQIGDPITQKKLSDAIVKEARDLRLFTSITDNGAGGISCSVAEMAKESGGCRVRLETVPVKYPGLAPWQIWISESQERMTLAVPKNKWVAFQRLMQKRGVEATVIGTFTSSGKCVVSYEGKTIVNLSMAFLHDGLPARPMITEYAQPTFEDPDIRPQTNLTASLLTLMGRLTMASTEFITR